MEKQDERGGLLFEFDIFIRVSIERKRTKLVRCAVGYALTSLPFSPAQQTAHRATSSAMYLS